MIKKISRKEIEDCIKKHFNIKEIKYYVDHGYEGYSESYTIDYEFVEGEQTK